MFRQPTSLSPLRTIATAAGPRSKVEEVLPSSSHSTKRKEEMWSTGVDTDETDMGKVSTG
jgi:hypothetical protein